MLAHTPTCAIHQAPFCTCGAIGRWAAEALAKPRSPTPLNRTTTSRPKAA